MKSYNKRKMLIAGGGYADIPLIQAAKNLGFYVITSGNRANDLGHRYSDECQLEDFSNKEAMLQLARKLQIDAICACCNDFSAISAAYVAEKMGLPGHDDYETAKLIHHKDLYRQFAHQYNIPSPVAKHFSRQQDALAFVEEIDVPFMVKPVDLTGGKGVSLVDDKSDAERAIVDALNISRQGRIVLEEYVAGSRHGLSAFLVDGKVRFYFADDEYYYLNNYLVSAASSPGTPDKTVLHELVETSDAIAKVFQLKHGIFHIQYILTPDGKPVIIEICRRAPGDLYIRFVQLASGIDYPEMIVRASAGMECNHLRQRETKGFFTRHCVMASRNGKLHTINFSPLIRENVIEKFMWWQHGDIVDNYMTQKFGIVFLAFQSFSEMKEKTLQMQQLIQAQVI